MSLHLSSKEKVAVALLAVLALTCVIFVLIPRTPGDMLVFLISFPFAQLGQGFRALSMLGVVGNVIAFSLYIAICLLPIVTLALIRNKRLEDALLPVISIALFYILYQMANPGRTQIGAGSALIERALLGGIIYSLLLAYGVLRVLRLFCTANAQELSQYMRVMLYVLNTILVIVIFGTGLGQMLAAFEAARIANIGNQHLLGTTYVFIALRHIVNALPHGLNIWVAFAALRLLSALQANPYSEETLAAARTVTKVCRIALGVTVITAAGLNLLQLLFVNRLRIIDSNLNIPVTSILFVLAALLLTRNITENKRLKDENDQFV